MTVLFGGGEMGAFIPSDGNVVEAATAGDYEAAFSRGVLSIATPTSYAESFAFAAQDELWVHCYLADGTGGSNDGPQALVLTNASGTDLFRLVWSASTLQMQYWNGSAWTNTGSAISVNIVSAPQHIDLYVKGNTASGTATLYLSGTERTTASVDLSSVAAITKVRAYGASVSSALSQSQVVVDTNSTIGNRLTTVVPTGAGSTSDMTGGYTEVDELVCSDADFINSATANQVELFTHSTTVPTGYRVKAVIVTARAKRGSASGPQNLQLALRSGGTTYFSSTQAVGLGYGAHVAVWETDPATAAAFTASAITSLQFGVKSIA